MEENVHKVRSDHHHKQRHTQKKNSLNEAKVVGEDWHSTACESKWIELASIAKQPVKTIGV
jgi:hypothetical protein